MKNLLSRLGKTLSLVEGCFYRPEFHRCHLGALHQSEDCCCRRESHHCHPEFHRSRHPEPHHRSHPEFISGSREGKQMLKQVQHDDYPTGKIPNPVQYDDRFIGQASNSAQYNGWYRTSLSFGRSMIEMLGVLAIIGVLSVGGLVAYRQAMIRHQNNILISSIGYGIMAVQTLCGENNTYTCPLFWNNETSSGYPYSVPTTQVCAQIPGCRMINAFEAHFEGTPLEFWHIYSNFDINPRLIYRFYLRGVQKSLCKQIINSYWPELRSMHIRVDDPTFPYEKNGSFVYKIKEGNASFTAEEQKIFNAACDYIDGSTDIILSFYLQ